MSDLFEVEDPDVLSAQEKNWACVKSLVGPRCIHSSMNNQGFKDDDEEFYTQAECLASDCYRQGPDMLESPDLVSLMGEYLNLGDLERLAIYEQPMSAAIARQRDLRSVASEFVDEIFDDPKSGLADLSDRILQEDESENGLSPLTVDILEIFIDRMLKPGIRAATVYVEAEIDDDDTTILDAIQQLFPDQFQDFIWAIVGRNGNNRPKIVGRIDLDEGGFPPLTSVPGFGRIVMDWVRDKQSKDELSSQNVDSLVRAMVEYLASREERGENMFRLSEINALLADLAMALMNPSPNGKLAATDKHLRLLNDLLMHSFSERKSRRLFVDGVRRVKESLSPAAANNDISVSDAYDELLSTLIREIVIDRRGLERLGTSLDSLVAKAPKTRQTIDNILMGT